jgi:hypothetical protein
MRRVLTSDSLRDRLAAGTRPSVEAISRDRVYGRLEELLSEAVG